MTMTTTTQNEFGTQQTEKKVLKVLTQAQELGFEIVAKFDGNYNTSYDLTFEGIRYRMTFGKTKGLTVQTYAYDRNGWNYTSAISHRVSTTKAGFASDMVAIHAGNKLHGINA